MFGLVLITMFTGLCLCLALRPPFMFSTASSLGLLAILNPGAPTCSRGPGWLVTIAPRASFRRAKGLGNAMIFLVGSIGSSGSPDPFHKDPSGVSWWPTIDSRWLIYIVLRAVRPIPRARPFFGGKTMNCVSPRLEHSLAGPWHSGARILAAAGSSHSTPHSGLPGATIKPADKPVFELLGCYKL